MKDFQQLATNYWLKLRSEQPQRLVWGGVALACFLYYLFILLPLNFGISSLQDGIQTDRTEAAWMAKASQEILRLRLALPHQRVTTNASAFTIVNQSINEQGWNNLVSDVHQVEQNKVQVNFNGIAFNELVTWIEKLFDKYGIYVVEATLQKNQPGVVQATLILQMS